MTITFIPHDHVGKFKCSTHKKDGLVIGIFEEPCSLCGEEAIICTSYPTFLCKSCCQYFSDKMECIK